MKLRYKKTIRLDEETLMHWNYLKSISVNPQNIIREVISERLKTKAIEMKIELKKERLPF